MDLLLLDPKKVNERRSKLEKAAEQLVMGAALHPMQDKSPGAWIKKYGKRFPLDQFKAKHFDHFRDCKRLL